MSDENQDELVLDQTDEFLQALENGSDGEKRMLLGGRGKIRIAGTIRPGKQVPLSRCTADEKALFAKLEAEGVPYDDINRQMGGKPKSRESKLTMVNADHFVLHEYDFKKPADMAFILREYADKDGRVRTIPIYFTTSDIDAAAHHGYTAFDGRNQIRCSSFYDGVILKFRYVEKSVEVPKASDWKVLDSDLADDATKSCGYKVTFAATYRFSIKGINGIGDFVLHNKSWNGTTDAVSVLEKMKDRLGRIDGTFRGRHLFNLCKVEDMVKHDGKKKRQFLVTLESAVDQMEIEAYREPEAVVARASNAMSMLTGRRSGTSVSAPCSGEPYVPGPGGFIPPDDPAPAPVADVKAAEPAPSQAIIDRIYAMVLPHGLFMTDLEDLFSASFRGEVLAEGSQDDLRAFGNSVRDSLKSHAEQFVTDVKALRNP